MASARQIAANRRNAQKSTGPRSEAGKRRASRNAYRHGLAAAVRQSGKFAVQIETLAHEIAGAAAASVVAIDSETLQYARTAAQAELDLARIRGMKTATLSALVAAATSQTTTLSHDHEIKHLAAVPGHGAPLSELSLEPTMPKLLAPEPKPQTELMRSLLTDILKLDRYERRALGRRDRAVLQIVARNFLMNNCKL